MNTIDAVRVTQSLLQSQRECDTIVVSRRDLEQEHTHLLGRIQQLRRLLGYPPLPTGKQLRQERRIQR